MELSIPGLVVAAVLLVLGRSIGSPLLTALMCALPFGATAWATLPALGGSSPQIYTLFAMALIFAAVFRPQSAASFSAMLARHWTMPLLGFLAIYAVTSSIVLPRLFQGQTSAFVPIKGAIFEVPLSPVNGNVTQSAYFVLGVLCCFALAVEMYRRKNWSVLQQAMLSWCIVNAMLGGLDIGGKLIGIPDVWAPIRTAGYAYLTETQEAGFWRIAGGFSETSGFAAHTLACVGFAFAYWRETGSWLAATVAAVNALLLVFSTSTTAYVALALISIPVAVSVIASLTRARVRRREIQLLLLSLSAMFMIAIAIVAVPKITAPFLDLLDTMVLRKADSASGAERGYWNRRSLESVIDTFGLGVGFGSSRASSWIVAVISQLGVLGAICFACLLYAVARAPKAAALYGVPPGSVPAGLIRGARAGALATIVGASMSGAAADPGIVALLCMTIALMTAPTYASSRAHFTSGSSLQDTGLPA